MGERYSKQNPSMPDPISWAFSWPYFATAFALAYLIGSVPSGLLLARAAGLGDIRRVGSGNIGATNVLRTGRKGVAAATLILDVGKGAVSIFLGNMFGPDIAVTAGLGVVLGHSYSVWLGFRGGKGVATGFGVLVAFSWPVGLAALLTWSSMAALTRYASVASLVAAVVAPAFAWYLDYRQEAELAAVLGLLVCFAHRANIGRLIRGEENKIDAAGP